MRSIILIFFLLTGCSFNQNKDINNLSDINFLDNLSFEQFRIKLDEYAENNPYPNIDN
tara:strand:+ start:234 stop:407 length:174 start_codon:yes stop_codon:yes gene_type:complete